MKTNISMELNDQERSLIADVIDGKQTKRLATRAEICELAIKTIGGYLEDTRERTGNPASVILQRDNPDPTITRTPLSRIKDLSRIHPGEERLLAGKSEGYIIGWNRARADGK
jgi:hypothetical protein